MTLTSADEIALDDVQAEALRQWAQATEEELGTEETCECPLHGVMVGRDCARCG